jgi:hypothetical protein
MPQCRLLLFPYLRRLPIVRLRIRIACGKRAWSVNTPNRTTAAAFPLYAHGEVVADSAELHWPGLYVRRFRFPRVVDRFLVPATAEPLVVEQSRNGSSAACSSRKKSAFVLPERFPFNVWQSSA